MRSKTITPDSNHAVAPFLQGFAVQEDSSAAAVIEFRKGAVDGEIIWPLSLTADESAGIMFPEALACEGGVYVKEVSGSIAGVLFY